ncbi:MAG: MotA/TolQ/ExbB proton channel family protein, partial [Pseudomonadota bacterium]
LSQGAFAHPRPLLISEALTLQRYDVCLFGKPLRYDRVDYLLVELGSVTGMIETFQVITQFGNGDPKVMAGGISMALVTTVLGLVAAMPLLLAHNVLSSQAENIRNILEKQGIGLVAEQAERDMPKGQKAPNTVAENAA